MASEQSCENLMIRRAGGGICAAKHNLLSGDGSFDADSSSAWLVRKRLV